MKRAKWKIVIYAAVLAMLIAIIWGAYRYISNLNLKPSLKYITIEAFVTEIHSNQLGGRMYVTYNDVYDGIIDFDHSTRIYNEKGKKITGNELKAGDRLEIRLDGMVIYEPVDTFRSCYLIKVLPEDTAILNEVHVFSREDYWRTQIGTFSGGEAQVIIDAVNHGTWIGGNETYKTPLKLKVAGNILYYYPEDGIFYNRKKIERMVLDSDTKENVEVILGKYIEMVREDDGDADVQKSDD